MAKINQLQKELTKAVHAYNEKIRYHENKRGATCCQIANTRAI